MPAIANNSTSGDRMTSSVGSRARLTRDNQPIGSNLKAGWLKENYDLVDSALSNRVVLDKYSISEHQAKIDRTNAPKANDPPWRGEDIPVKKVDITGPTVIVGSDDVVAVWVFPGFFKTGSLADLNRITTDFATSELGPSMKKGKIMGGTSNGRKRGDTDTYTTDRGLYGTGTYCYAWHPQGHAEDTDFAPSKDMLRSLTVAETSARQKYFTDMQGLDERVNHLVSVTNPKFSKILDAIYEGVCVHPACRMCMTNIRLKFPGRSMICNRQSGEHLDTNGLRRGVDCLYAAGNFTGGEVYFKDLAIKVPMEPGTLLLFDGTSQRHSIEKWDGPQRFSFALFVHKGVAKQLELDTTLTDITIQMVRDHLSSIGRPKGKAAKRARPVDLDGTGGEGSTVESRRKKKKPGRGKGKFSKSKPGLSPAK